MVVGYFLLPKSARNYWLLLGSLFFYAWGEPKFLFAMLLSIVFNYFMALHIEELEKGSLVQKGLLAVTVLGNLGLLFVFKYLNFVIRVTHQLIPATQEMFPQTEILLPIGISFFTFQALSYVIDVYRGIPAQHNICHLGLYISLFPQLIAGPIVRYTTIADQIQTRQVTTELFSKGLLRFVRGFNKKVLLSNILAEVADKAFGFQGLSVGMAWLGAVCYTLQIYFDFGGYSDMAIGLGQMFGFRFLENFNYPYISKNVTEFWRRWHISLGSWFRDYVYFPLGGSRVSSRGRLIFNLGVVWLATGIWHGANWTFILWGVLHGVVVIVEKLLGLPGKLEEHRVWTAVYRCFTLLVVVFGWVLFRAESLSAAVTYIKAMLGLGGGGLVDGNFLFYFRDYFIILLAGLLCSTPLFRWAKERLQARGTAAGEYGVLAGQAFQLLLFVVGVSCLVMNAHNPFIYFNF